jgi:ferredoxin-NADP reductase
MLASLAAEGSERDVWWVHGARNAAEHAFAGEVRRYLRALPTRTRTSATADRSRTTATTTPRVT